MSPKRKASEPREVPGLGRPRKPRLPTVAERVLPIGLRVVAVRRPSVPVVHVRLRIPPAVRRDQDLARAAPARAHDAARAPPSTTRASWPRRCNASAARCGSAATPTGWCSPASRLRGGLGELLGLLAEVLTSADATRRARSRARPRRLADQLRRALVAARRAGRRGLAPAAVRRAPVRPRAPGGRRGAGGAPAPRCGPRTVGGSCPTAACSCWSAT